METTVKSTRVIMIATAVLGVAVIGAGAWIGSLIASSPAHEREDSASPPTSNDSPPSADPRGSGDMFGSVIDLVEKTKDEAAREVGRVIADQVSLTPEQQRAFGAQAFAEISRAHRPVTDRAAVDRVNRLTARVLTVTPIDFEPTVAVFDDPQVNAFALVGGHFGYYKGLLDAVGEDDEQLLFVVAHEISHVRLGHSRESASKLILPHMIPGAGPLGAAAINQLVSVAYSEAQEHEADDGACEALWRLGVDLDAGVRVMETLSRAGGSNDPHAPRPRAEGPEAAIEALDRHFATHPDSSERIARIEAWTPPAR